jgi:hypothetical protein
VAQAEVDKQILGANLLQGFTYNEDLVEFHVYSAPFVTEVSDRPEASLVARYQARNSMFITNLRHELIKIEGLSYYLLPFLDGSLDRAALLELLKQGETEGVIELQPSSPGTLAEVLEAGLRSLANAALLVR